MAQGIVRFFREVKQEGRKVAWPSRKETTTTTVVVLIMVFIMSMFFLVTDMVVSNVIEFILTLGS